MNLSPRSQRHHLYRWLICIAIAIGGAIYKMLFAG
jgi:hypothetical protein